jgi:hypothetical protein
MGTLPDRCFHLLIFLCSDKRKPWIIVHLARGTTEPDDTVGEIEMFTYLRLQIPCYVRQEFDLTHDRGFPQRFPTHVTASNFCHSVVLYEMTWSQQPEYPRLPIAHILSSIIHVLTERNAVRERGIFRIEGNESIVKEIPDDVNEDITMIKRGDLHVVATWLEN